MQYQYVFISFGMSSVNKEDIKMSIRFKRKTNRLRIQLVL